MLLTTRKTMMVSTMKKTMKMVLTTRKTMMVSTMKKTMKMVLTTRKTMMKGRERMMETAVGVGSIPSQASCAAVACDTRTLEAHSGAATQGYASHGTRYRLLE
jgi:hypothetical protein